MKRDFQNDGLGVSSLFWILILAFVLGGCSHILKYEKSAHLEKNDEFAQAVKIETVPEVEAPTPAPAPTAAPVAAISKKKGPKKKSPKATDATQSASSGVNGAEKAAKVPAASKKKAKKAVTPSEEAPAVAAAPAGRQPDLEDNEGFAPGSRRPLVDPFQRGEIVTHSVSYFKLSAGELKLKVEPFAQVNGKKAYTFAIEIESSSLFAPVYRASDRAETFVDFDQLIPRTFGLHVKESGQLREAKSFFDFDKNQATYWEKKFTEKNGEEEKKQQWEILPFTQNVYSALFYMRVFKWEIGKEYSFRVADDEKNLIFKGTAIRKEKLDTALGEMNAIVVKPEIILKGVFTPVGDIFIWLSDDEHKYILRIESKIKIGTLVSEVTSIVPGKP